ncbi:MAG: trimeric intracellular cation channel family protein [Ferruginibacter sp.]|nr:trimeric intracellular cation channel family protein [Ferruginibacter sp.]
MHYSFLHLIEVLGLFSFAVSGAFFAIEKKLDPFGVLIISFVTAIGGGTLRDIMIGNLPVGWLRNLTTIYAILSASFLTMFFEKYVRKLTKTLFLFDALGLGFYTILGIELAIQQHLSIGVCMALGTITACFGGVIRDVLLNNVPLVFRKELYAVASLAGGGIYFLLKETSLNADVSKIICILIIFSIRAIAVRYKIMLPLFYAKRN